MKKFFEKYGKPYVVEHDRVILYQKPCVYFAYGVGGLQYIGVSTQGLVRPLGPSHERVSQIEDLRLMCIPFDTEEAAKQAEAELLYLLSPPLNRSTPSRKALQKARRRFKRDPEKGQEGQNE
jgi:hypothetical protein